MRKQYLAIEAVTSANDVTPPSERSFALVFAVVFALVAAWAFWSGLIFAGVVLAALCLILLLVRQIRSSLLRPLNLAWFRVGLLLHHVVSPVIMFIIYVTAVLPTALFRRLFARAAFRKTPDPAASTYWIDLQGDETPARDSMRQQF